MWDMILTKSPTIKYIPGKSVYIAILFGHHPDRLTTGVPWPVSKRILLLTL
jgi:hypothetical protein